MNIALWKKNLREARWLLAGCAALMFAFHWLRVWLVSQVPLENFRLILNLLPSKLEKLMPVPFNQVATQVGRLAAAYDEPLVILIVTVWAIARGSDAISGEIGRGTMEMLLAQPVRRSTVLAMQAAVTLNGAAIIVLGAWAGTAVGLSLISLGEPISANQFFPCILNLFSLAAFLAGLTTLASSCDRHRWRTIGIIGAFYAVEMVVKVIGRVSPKLHWFSYFTFFTPFEPQALIADPRRTWTFWVHDEGGAILLGGLGYDAILLGLSLACYVAAGAIFARRDLPAPL
jgi:ABC-2 type transport system permease protein